MRALFERYRVNLSEKQEEKLSKYADLLEEYNGRFNLTAITDREEIFVKHFLDSALGISCVQPGNLIDIGSGGGLPAVPIAVFREDVFVTMLEATGKKCDFLNAVIETLNLKNARVLNGRAEEYSRMQTYRERFDCCTARAVARMNTLCEYALPFVRVGGSFVAYKGDAAEETAEAARAIALLGGRLKEEKRMDLEGACRTIVVVEKVKSTPPQYPRGRGKERKQPL